MKSAAFLIFAMTVCIASAQTFEPKLFSDMKWRSIGPYRGGRTRALAGVPDQPNVFYIAQVNGGVWKTTDYGRTWNPIFDEAPTGSVGAIAIAPSDSNTIYVGSGEGLQRPDLSTGDGIYKSTDAGQSWVHLGLRDGQQIPKISVDPRDPNRIFVAVLGHPYGANEERGIFRSTDGGQTFEKVLYKNENTGANDVLIDPVHPNTVYASLWEARQGPWENAAWSGTDGGIFKSTDGGATWRPLTKGLPAEGVIQANLAIAASDSTRLYASVASEKGVGLYRSDDSGETWARVTEDTRPAERIGGGDLPVPAVDPQNPDIVYSASIVTWKSTDGGKSWKAIRGAPGGDDYQSIWINPHNPQILLIVSDQGAIITVNGGSTWSSWYNQPTAQMYHASTDDAFPYRVCSGQQESGSACVSSRGNDGEITFREWHPVGVEEYGYAVPDPLDPDLVYGGKVTRYDRRTGQTVGVGPKPVREPGYRTLRTAPLVFSPIDPHVLYFGANTLWMTRNGGASWQQISPDLTRKTWEAPKSIGKYLDTPGAKVTQRGVIYAVAPSPLNIQRIWAGTDDGLIHLTSDGGLHWQDVTPPELKPFAKVSIIEAGHFDVNSAYAAVNTLRLDEMHPHIFRTHDSGKTWTEIVAGIPDGAPINVVREDPRRKGLLFAGSEREVYVSLDDGDHWQSLRLNMPATSIRDVVIKGDDLVAATHGRGFWILDDITPLRQVDPSKSQEAAKLFQPQTAIRVRWDMNTDTPLPPDEPAGQNPPDGAIINYYVGSAQSGPVTLEILDSAGKLVRKYASDDPVAGISPKLEVPAYWVRPPRQLRTEPGMHRFLWDMHYPPVAEDGSELPMQAVPFNTAPAANSPWVMPGVYTVKLSVGEPRYSQPLTVKMDPRVRTTQAGLAQQFTLSMQVYRGIQEVQAAVEQIHSLAKQLAQLQQQQVKAEALGPLADALPKLEGVQGARFGGGGRLPISGPETFTSIGVSLKALLQNLQEADVAPATQVVKAVASKRAALTKLSASWTALQEGDLRRLNNQLREAHIPPVTAHP